MPSAVPEGRRSSSGCPGGRRRPRSRTLGPLDPSPGKGPPVSSGIASTGCHRAAVVEVAPARGGGRARRGRPEETRRRSCTPPARHRRRRRRGASARGGGRPRVRGRRARMVARSKARPRSWRSSCIATSMPGEGCRSIRCECLGGSWERRAWLGAAGVVEGLGAPRAPSLGARRCRRWRGRRAGSAHHQPRKALALSPTRSTADRRAQRFVCLASATAAAEPRAGASASFLRARIGMSTQRQAGHHDADHAGVGFGAARRASGPTRRRRRPPAPRSSPRWRGWRGGRRPACSRRAARGAAARRGSAPPTPRWRSRTRSRRG